MSEDVLRDRPFSVSGRPCSIALVALGRKWVVREGRFVDEGLVCPGLVGE